MNTICGYTSDLNLNLDSDTRLSISNSFLLHPIYIISDARNKPERVYIRNQKSHFDGIRTPLYCSLFLSRDDDGKEESNASTTGTLVCTKEPIVLKLVSRLDPASLQSHDNHHVV